MSDHPDGHLAQRAHARFAQACDTLDDATRAELQRRRRVVLTGAGRPRSALWRPLAPVGAMATAIAIAAVLLGPGPNRMTPAALSQISPDAARETADETAQALDDDPEFYLWLATEPVAGDDPTDTESGAVEESDR